MKNDVVFIGIGQCGGNIAFEMQKKGYLAGYINSSVADLNSIDSKIKYHIPGAHGCAKDQNKAAGFAKDYYNSMIDFIESNFPYQKHIIFTASAGGGTGSTIAPIMISIMNRSIKIKKKTFSLVLAMPSLKGVPLTIQNALKTYKKVVTIERISNVYLLDNDSREDEFEVNKEFAYRFDAMFNITNPDMQGIIDQEEIMKMLRCKGNTVIETFNSLNYSCNSNFNKSIFLPYESGCQYLAYSTTDKVNPYMLYKKFGTPVDPFVGYNKSLNIVMATGLPYPIERIYKYQSAIKIRNEMIEKRKGNVFDYEVPQVENNHHIVNNVIPFEDKKQIATRDENDFSDIFEPYNSFL